MLRRFFARLATAYPSAVTRDELAEYLWPDSDGDRAIRNLYSATVDLRRLLAALPGVAVTAGDGGYALRCEGNVEFADPRTPSVRIELIPEAKPHDVRREA